MKKNTIYTFLVFLLLTVQFAQAQDKGTVKIDALESKALASNLTKEDTKRPLAIYLPPNYSDSTKRYPVLYLLHGIGDDHLNFVDDTEKYQNIRDLMDYGIASHRFGEIIIVTPNEKTNWFGSFYTNSSVTGNWEDFTAKELVNYIDTNYRTIAKAESRAIAGHSMGGYGVLNAAGAGYSGKLDTFFTTMTGGSKAMQARTTNNAEYKASFDTRIKAVVAFAPWGMQRNVWDAEGLAGLKVPTFFIAGNQDDISGYEDGIKAIYKGAVNADRYLLTYMNARHNVAPNPPPPESMKAGLHIDEYYRYAEPAWNEKRINNINQHFVTAFLGIHLKKAAYEKYLNLNENANDKLWIGFKPRSAVGLELLHSGAAK